jgi:hypothetical protein
MGSNMPKIGEINIEYTQIKDLILQLDFKERMKLINELIGDENYQKSFYSYTQSLVKKHNIPEMTENELDDFLHKK